MKRCWLILAVTLSMSIFSVQDSHKTSAQAGYCIQYNAHSFQNYDTPYAIFLASPAQRIVKPFPNGRQPHAYGGKSGGVVSPDGHYVAQIQPTLGKVPKPLLIIENRQALRTVVIKPVEQIDSAHLSWSNSGNRLAFLEQEDGQFQVGIVSADGSQLRKVSIKPKDINLDAEQSALSWSADDRYIAVRYGLGTERLVLLLQSSDLQTASDSPQRLVGPNFSWSAHGHRFVTWSDEELSLRSAEGQFRQDFTVGMVGSDYQIEWSPDDSYIAVLWGYHHSQQTLNVYGIDGTAITNLKGPVLIGGIEGPLYRSEAHWSPDSRYFTYARLVNPNSTDINGQFDLVSVDVKRHQINVLAPLLASRDIQYSPDRRRLAAAIKRSKQSALLLTSADGGNKVIWEPGAEFETFLSQLSWSPDGRYIAFVLASPSVSPNVRLVWIRTDGKGETSLAYRSVFILRWEMSKNLLLYLTSTGNSSQVMALDVTSGRAYPLTQPLPQLLYENTSIPAFGRWAFFPSPDNHSVVMEAVVDFADAGPGGPGEGLGVSLYLSTWNGSLIRQLDTFDDPLISSSIWSPNGTMFAYSGTGVLKFFYRDGRLLWNVELPEDYSDINPDSLVWVACEA